VVIDANQPVAAFALYNNVDKNSGDEACWAGISAVTPGTGGTASYTYFVPYYNTTAGYFTSLALRNSNATNTATVTVAAYTDAGAAVALDASFTGFTVDPSGQWADVLSVPAGEGWIEVTSDQPLTGLAWVGMLDGIMARIMADISLIGELGATRVVPHVANTAVVDGGWTTIANICNPHPTATDVTITYFSAAGASSYSTTVSIPANGSVSKNLGDFIPDTGRGSVVIDANQPVAAFALYNNVDKNSGDEACWAGISAVAP